jgi:hypothetical protein
MRSSIRSSRASDPSLQDRRFEADLTGDGVQLWYDIPYGNQSHKGDFGFS